MNNFVESRTDTLYYFSVPFTTLGALLDISVFSGENQTPGVQPEASQACS